MNPLVVEYVEYVTSEPQSFGAALERLGFVAVACHRSREIVPHRGSGMNIIVNADPSVAISADGGSHGPRLTAFTPVKRAR